MRVVLDTNIIVAALATRGACAELFARVLAVHDYGVDANLHAEVERVLRVKFKLPDERIAAARELLASTGIAVDSVPLSQLACRDPDDDRILALALAFTAEVLVTGDDDLLLLHPWSGISIVRPRDFWPIDRAAAAVASHACPSSVSRIPPRYFGVKYHRGPDWPVGGDVIGSFTAEKHDGDGVAEGSHDVA